MENKYVVLFTDGSCLGNPGKGGIGYIISYHKDCEIIGSQGYKSTTNNRMELLAVVKGLETIIDNINNDTIEKPVGILVYTDSKYVSDSINKNWLLNWNKNGWKTSNHTRVKNKKLWQKFESIYNKIIKEMGINININHVYGHQGNDLNERCDHLAQSAAKGNNLIIDEGYD
jgi:ribonuclease HI